MILTVEFNIPDIHCKKCANKILLALQFTAGISSTTVNFENKHTIVQIDPTVINVNITNAMLGALGFNAMIL